MSTWTIDDMPESERPKRNIFRDQTQPPTRSEPQPQPAPQSQQAGDHSDCITRVEWDTFRRVILDALAGFPAARAAVIAAVDRAMEELAEDQLDPQPGCAT